MKKLILIGGDLASGKSTFSEILKERFSLFVVNKDRFKEILGDYIDAPTREENKKLSKIAFAMMCYLLRSNQDTIVMESNFKPYEMDELIQLCKEEKYEILSLKFQGDDQILQQRFLKRLNHRHKVHMSQDFSSLPRFVAAQNELRSVQYPGKVISVCCDDFSYQQDEKLFDQIQTFLESK